MLGPSPPPADLLTVSAPLPVSPSPTARQEQVKSPSSTLNSHPSTLGADAKRRIIIDEDLDKNKNRGLPHVMADAAVPYNEQNQVAPRAGHVGLEREQAPFSAPLRINRTSGPDKIEEKNGEEDDASDVCTPPLLSSEFGPNVETPSQGNASTNSAPSKTSSVPLTYFDLPTVEILPPSSSKTVITSKRPSDSTGISRPVPSAARKTPPIKSTSSVSPTLAVASSSQLKARSGTSAAPASVQTVRRNSNSTLARDEKRASPVVPPANIAGQKRRRSAPSTSTLFDQLLSGSVQDKAPSMAKAPAQVKSGSLAGETSSSSSSSEAPRKRIKRSVRFKSDDDLVETRVYELQPGEEEDKRIAAGSRPNDGQQKDHEQLWKALTLDTAKKVDRDQLRKEELEDERQEEEEQKQVTQEDERAKAEPVVKKTPWYLPRKVWLSDALLYTLAEPGSESMDRVMAEEAGFPTTFPSRLENDNDKDGLGEVVQEEPTEALYSDAYLPENLRTDTAALSHPFELLPGREENNQQETEVAPVHDFQQWQQPQQQQGTSLISPSSQHTTGFTQQQQAQYTPQWHNEANQSFGQVANYAWGGAQTGDSSSQTASSSFLPTPKGMPVPMAGHNQAQGAMNWSQAAPLAAHNSSNTPGAPGPPPSRPPPRQQQHNDWPSQAQSQNYGSSAYGAQQQQMYHHNNNGWANSPHQSSFDQNNNNNSNNFGGNNNQYYPSQGSSQTGKWGQAANTQNWSRYKNGGGGGSKFDKFCRFKDTPRGCVKEDCPYRHDNF